ncbi:hypothetical protein FQA39_LY08202 [Lamprigera yunnana]|nr:hypothetical protein FQA39_LY08202 [Lamprigera yunnana]
MSLTTLTATRIHLGQLSNSSGEETFLSFEKFPYTGLSKTYCVDRQVADSACSATAYLCGIKANEATIGVNAAVKLHDCEGMNNASNRVNSIAHQSQLAGKRSGIVTTTRVTHASPAGAYAHIASRDWEADTDVINDEKNPEKCIDIAQQLIHGETGKNFNVIFGGGRSYFLPKELSETIGYRSDGRNLIDEWKKQKKDNNVTSYEYVEDLPQLKKINGDTEYVLGLFNSDHLSFNLDRDVNNEPSLQEMTEKAIEVLSQGDKGFFLFVEGGKIDHAHHATQAAIALDETIEFHKAIETAVNLTNEEDTLIVVTSDHSHTMTLNGYPVRGNDILGIGGRAEDKRNYTTLTYANGPSADNTATVNITEELLGDKDFGYPSLFLLGSETHGGDDVGIFARGPWAHLFSGVTEQHVIPHILSYASCVGGNETACSNSKNVVNTFSLTILSLTCITMLQNFLL